MHTGITLRVRTALEKSTACKASSSTVAKGHWLPPTSSCGRVLQMPVYLHCSLFFCFHSSTVSRHRRNCEVHHDFLKTIILYMHAIKWFLKLLWWIRTKFGRCWLKHYTKHIVESWKLNAEVFVVLFYKGLLFQHLLFFLGLSIWLGDGFRLGTKMLHELTHWNFQV